MDMQLNRIYSTVLLLRLAYVKFRKSIFSPGDVKVPTEFTNGVSVNIFRVSRVLKRRWNSLPPYSYEFLKPEWNLWDVRHSHNATCVNTVKVHSYMGLFWLHGKYVEREKKNTISWGPCLIKLLFFSKGDTEQTLINGNYIIATSICI